MRCPDSVAFRQQASLIAASMAAKFRAVSPALADHFNRHIERAIQQFVFEPHLTSQWVCQQWTNNGCESINHILKLPITWRPRRLRELVDYLYKWWT